MSRLGALAGALGILAFAWWFDRLFELSRLEAARTFDPNPMVWALPVAQLVLAGLLLIFAWFAIVKNRGSMVVFLIFLLVGLLLVFSFSLQVLAPLSLLPWSFWQPLTAFLPVPPRSLYFQASAFMTIIGLVGLAARRRPSFGK